MVLQNIRQDIRLKKDECHAISMELPLYTYFTSLIEYLQTGQTGL